MNGWRLAVFGCIGLLWIALGATSADAEAKRPKLGAHWLFSSFTGAADSDWDPGFGFGLNGTVPLHRGFELRADCGGRWLEGGPRLAADRAGQPRWGGPVGFEPDGIRVTPVTLSFVHRGERYSHGRFWVPYFGAGPGFYDMRASYRSIPNDVAVSAVREEWNHNLFRFGWHGRAGAYLYRTSGLYIDLGGAVHYIDVPGKWSPLWELSFGIGTHLRGRSR